MLTRLTAKLATRSSSKSPLVLSRNKSNAVALANTEYQKNEPTGNPFIVMHGLFGSKSNWNSLCKVFAQKTNPPRKIISVDARNHGDSPQTPDHSYNDMSNDIVKFLADRQIEKASLLGHSMGGRTMMHFALRHPQLVERLIVADISPVSAIGTSQTDIPLFLKAMRSIALPSELTIHQARKVADEELSKIINSKPLRDFLITNLVKSDSGDFRWRLNLETLDRSFKDGQEGFLTFPDATGLKFEGPTLFIAGSKSDYVSPDDKPKIDKLFPNSELVWVDAGHWLHAEKPEEFSRLVLNFLNKA